MLKGRISGRDKKGKKGRAFVCPTMRGAHTLCLVCGCAGSMDVDMDVDEDVEKKRVGLEVRQSRNARRLRSGAELRR